MPNHPKIPQNGPFLHKNSYDILLRQFDIENGRFDINFEKYVKMTSKMAVFFIFWKWPIYFTIYYRIWAQKVCSHARCKVPPFTCFSGYLLRVLFYSFRMWVQDSHFSFSLISVSAQFTSHEIMFMCSRALSRCHAFPVLMFSTSSQFSHLNPDQSQIQFPPDLRVHVCVLELQLHSLSCVKA